MSDWILIAALGGLASNASNFLFRYILKSGDDPSGYAWFHETFRLIFFSFVLLFGFDLVVSPISPATLIGLGVVEFAAAYYLMKMHAYSHLSISTIISRTRLIWVPVIAFFMFGETLERFHYLGIVILFFGLSIVSSPKKIFRDRGIRYAYLAAFIIALVNVFLKLSSAFADIPVTMVFMSLPSVLLFPLVLKTAKKRIVSSVKTNFPLKLLTGLINALSMYLLAWAIKLGPISLVTAVYQSMMLTSVLAGIFVLREKEDVGKKIVGSIISLIGVLLLTV